MMDYFGYKGKKVVVTGASSGMGKAAAEMLVDLGAEVYCLNRSEAKVDGIAASISTDLSSRESIDAAFAQLPEEIDSFFGIAGASGAHCDFITTVKIDLLANVYITNKYLAKRMSAGGSIGFITSVAGCGWEAEPMKGLYLPVVSAEWDAAVAYLESSPLSQQPGNMGYPFAKQAMHFFVAQCQSEFAPRNIRVNAVLPGSTDTGLTEDFSNMTGGMENLLLFTGYAERLARPEEMAAPIVFLNSRMASYVSGDLMVVDFGQNIENTAQI